MRPSHFIDVLIAAYEQAYTALKAGSLAEANESAILNVAILAADQVARHDWHGAGLRAGQVAAAILRHLFPDSAVAEAESLHAFVQLAIFAGDPDPAP